MGLSSSYCLSVTPPLYPLTCGGNGSIVAAMLPRHDFPATPLQTSDALGKSLATESLRPLVDRAFPGKHVDFQVSPLQGDASDRRYYRLDFATAVDSITSLVLMRLGQPYSVGELPFVNVQRYLSSNKIPVPDIVWDDSSHGFILLEDLGDVTLEAALQGASPEQMASWYRRALDILLALQHPERVAPRASCIAFCLAFDVEKLMWELDFFVTHMIKHLCAQQLRPVDETALRGQFWKITAMLARQPRVFTHRDYHSRNLMVHQDRLRVIDFQDARLGPCQYDLASLLYDSYVVLPADLREALLTYYLRRKATADGYPLARESFSLVFDYMCLQRHLKALGTFAFQTVVKRTSRYVTAIPPTLGYIQENLARHPELRQLRDLLEAYLFEAVPNALQDVERRTPDRSPVR
jgi:aminoglycoside/choline kinase family phosphotransferase